jgi:hypothetical protein
VLQARGLTHAFRHAGAVWQAAGLVR